MGDLKQRYDRDKQRNYYYLERNKFHINGCCTFEEGYYCGYHESKAVRYEMESWATGTTVKRVLRQLVKIKGKFKVQTERNKVPDAIDELYADDAPFEYTYRFDLFTAFIRVNKLSKILGQITSAAAFKEDRSVEKGDAVTIPGSSKDDNKKPDASVSSWKYDDAAQQYNKGVEELEEIIASGMWSYTRLRFESETKVLWCVGPPKCIEPKQETPCPDNGGGNGSCPKPPPCDGTTYSLSKLVNLLNSEKPNGRGADKYYIEIMDILNPDCDAMSKTIKLTSLDNTIKIPAHGFLFAPRGASSSDNVVYRVRFDLNSNKVQANGQVECDDLPS